MFAGAPVPDPDGIQVTWQGITAALGGLLLVGAALKFLWSVLFSPMVKLMGRTNEFLDDWFGVPDRDGVPGRKGVMARLSDLEIEKVDREEFKELANTVALTATRQELLELRVALQRHITRVEEPRDHSEGDVSHPRETAD